MPPTNTNPRLKELLTALGCPDAIAPWPWDTPEYSRNEQVNSWRLQRSGVSQAHKPL